MPVAVVGTGVRFGIGYGEIAAVFGHKHYVPILKGKRGDLWALRNLKPATCGSITPLIEVVPPSPSRDEVAQLTWTANSLNTSWPNRPVFVDLLWREALPPLPSGAHVVDEFFGRARGAGVLAIPVTSPVRNPAYQEAVRRVAQHDRRGLAIRIPPDVSANPQLMGQAIEALLDLMGLGPSQVDIVLDYRAAHLDAGLLAQVMGLGVAAMPHGSEWRTVTVAAGSFPASVASLSQASWTTIARSEWMAWRLMITNTQPPSRLPSYGDYAVGDPGLPFAGRANLSANLRYSSGDHFLVWRGYVVQRHPQGHGQMFGICADLVARPEFAGAAFSQGDFEILARSTNQGSPGSPESWRQWATNHYLELAASQVASLPGP